MRELYICQGLMCAVYVFGGSSGGICPNCNDPGRRVPREQTVDIEKAYRITQW